MALLLWVLIILATVTLILFGFGGIQWAHVDLFTYNRLVDANGRELVYQQIPNAAPGASPWLPVYLGTTQPATTPVHYVRLLTPPTQPATFYHPGRFELAILSSLSAALGLLTGILLVVLFWHWNKKRYFLVLLLPFAAAAWDLLVMCRFEDNAYEYIRLWATERVLYHAAIQTAFILLGILIGRPLARLLLRMFIPPKPRQHLAFLWQHRRQNPSTRNPRMTSTIDPLFVLSNHLEAVLWSSIGIIFLFYALRTQGIARRECLIAAVTFVLFGISDLVEARTGARWRPFWLLLWKGLCLLVLAILLMRYSMRRRAR